MKFYHLRWENQAVFSIRKDILEDIGQRRRSEYTAHILLVVGTCICSKHETIPPVEGK